MKEWACVRERYGSNARRNYNRRGGFRPCEPCDFTRANFLLYIYFSFITLFFPLFPNFHKVFTTQNRILYPPLPRQLSMFFWHIELNLKPGRCYRQKLSRFKRDYLASNYISGNTTHWRGGTKLNPITLGCFDELRMVVVVVVVVKVPSPTVRYQRKTCYGSNLFMVVEDHM